MFRFLSNRVKGPTPNRGQSGMKASASPAPARMGIVHLVGAGPGDPDLLTLKALRLLQSADVVIHDRLVSSAILALVAPSAVVIEAGKTGFGASWRQDDINALLIAKAGDGARVVRLKGGDPVVFGRLDEEIAALEAAGVAFEVVPGITSASAAAAAIGASLTRRGRNSGIRMITGHDIAGYAEQDWRALAAEGAAAIYMGVKAAAFLRGRLMMHGARADTPVTAIENASRPAQRVIATTLLELPEALAEAAPTGPVMILFGLAPRAAEQLAPAAFREAL